MIATVLVLGMTLLSLGASTFLRRHASDAADLKYTGYMATQALYAAEMGINDMLYNNNIKATRNAPLDIPPNYLLAPVTIAYPGYTATQSIAYRIVTHPTTPNPAPNVYRYVVTADVSALLYQPAWPMVSRQITFDVASGSHWVLKRYEQN